MTSKFNILVQRLLLFINKQTNKQVSRSSICKTDKVHAALVKAALETPPIQTQMAPKELRRAQFEIVNVTGYMHLP